jgi:hypothetical protein
MTAEFSKKSVTSDARGGTLHWLFIVSALLFQNSFSRRITMEKSIRKLFVMGLLAVVFAWNTLAAEPAPPESNDPNASEPNVPASVKPLVSRDFRIDVETNRSVYLNRDVLRLSVKLLNDSVRPVFIGVCPIEPAVEPAEQAEIEEIAQGFLDDEDVDVAIMPCIPRFIGYATLTRLGPSPVPCPILSAEKEPAIVVKPRKFRLPLFGLPRVPGHSTRIISAANILISGPLLDVEGEPAGAENKADEPLEIEIIPAVGRCVPVRPGYYLLDCRIEKICGTPVAQAQKIIRIRPRIIRPVPKPNKPTTVLVK